MTGPDRSGQADATGSDQSGQADVTGQRGQADVTGPGRSARQRRAHRVLDALSTGRVGATSLTYYALLVITLFLLALGLSMVFSVQSVTVTAQGHSAMSGFGRYLVYAVLGLAAMVWGSRRSRRFLVLAGPPLLLGAILIQLMVFVPGLRYCAGGNCNWIQVPGIGTFQPSELIKVGLALYLGWLVEVQRGRVRALGGPVVQAAAIICAIGAVLAGRDLGTVIILVLETAGGLWLMGARLRWFVVGALVGTTAFAGFTMLSANRRGRILAWLNPEGSDPLGIAYQPIHGEYALGTGGWTGVGPGSSRQKWGYLTQADSDYIFAVLGEELGVVGTVVVIALFAGLGACCLRLMRRSNDLYVSVVVGALMVWVVGQALVNMSVVVGLLPVLGVPLPLVSAGGSALVCVLAGIGVLQALARQEPGAPEAFSTRPGAGRRTLAVVSPSRRNRA